MPSIVLASASPRRRELLARLGVVFRVEPADLDETPRPGERPAELVVRLAREKADLVFRRLGGGSDVVVLAADTEVARGRRIYGKPKGPEDATRMLRSLAGRSHRVISAVAVASASGTLDATVSSRVWLRALDDAEIEAYVASGDPLDKAGAYAVQNESVRPVARLTGCRCSVMGLPIGVVADLLARSGARPPVPPDLACPYGAYAAGRCLAASSRATTSRLTASGA